MTEEEVEADLRAWIDDPRIYRGRQDVVESLLESARFIVDRGGKAELVLVTERWAGSPLEEGYWWHACLIARHLRLTELIASLENLGARIERSTDVDVGGKRAVKEYTEALKRVLDADTGRP